MIRTQWRVIAGVTGLVVLAVALGTYLQTPVYRAVGMMEIRKQGADVVPVEALFQAARVPSQYLETQYEILRSPALARRVVDTMQLVEVPEFNPEAGEDLTDVDLAAVRERAMQRFHERLTINPLKESQLVEVRFESEDPVLAARAVNLVFSTYIQMRVDAARTAVERLSEQVANARSDLAQAELRLNQFARANQLLLVETGDGQRENIPQERLRRLQQELTTAEAERYEKEALYQLVLSEGGEALNSEVLQSLSIHLAELRGEYAKLRATFTDEYPRTRQVRRQIEELQAQLEAERLRIEAEVRNDYLAARERQSLLQSALAQQQGQIESLAAGMTEYQILHRDVEGQRQLYATLQQKQKEAEVSAALAATEVGVVDLASPPQFPIRPQPKSNLQLGLLMGLMLGLGIAFMRELSGREEGVVEEMDALAVPILAMIPSFLTGGGENGLRPTIPVSRRLGAPGGRASVTEAPEQWYRIDAENGQQASLAEAFGSLRTSVLFDTPHAPRTLMITSGQPGEGKTTISTNLAISLSWLKKRVLLVDADLRRPSVHRAFDLPSEPGLADYLSGSGKWSEFVRTDPTSGIHLLLAGHLPHGPAELLSSARMRHLLQEAEKTYDFVILDTPALAINAADARILATQVDGVLLVVRGGATSRDMVRHMVRQVHNLVGVVFNDIDLRRYLRVWHPNYEYTSRSGGRESAPEVVNESS